MGIPNHLTFLLRNLYVGQEATVELCMEQMIDLRQRKEYDGSLLSSCLFNLYAEHIMRYARPDKLQSGIKIDGRNINNLRADDITLMARSEEEVKRN